VQSIPWKSILDCLAEAGEEHDLRTLCWRALTGLERGPVPLRRHRQAGVARLLCQRLTARQIASALDISLRTVEQHVQDIYRKLGVHGREELVRTLCARSDDGQYPGRLRRGPSLGN
jgi:DNA-binding transcriptional ArsR family regulator